MARPSWKGHLRLSLVACEVTLTPATTESERISFHMLNPETQNRVKQQLVDSQTGDVVERGDVVKGYEFEKGQYVIIDDDEIEKVKIESTHTIDIERFVDRDEVDDIYYNKPYFMAPEGKISEEAFAVIRDAMERQGKIAIGRLVLSAREHVVAIEPHGKGMSLTTLRAANEVRSEKTAFADIKDVKIDADMVKLAESIIVGKAGPFDPASFEDRYQAALRELVEAKLKGKKVTLPKSAEPSNVVNLMDALRRSVQDSQARERAPSRKTSEKTPKRKAASTRKRKAS
jgi:DNA end-binding protein Ku